MRIKEKINDSDQAKLNKLRDELLPIIYLPRPPAGGGSHPSRDKHFVSIQPRIEGDDYWPEMVGRICDVEVRYNYRPRFRAKLVYIGFKKFVQLTEVDARAAGIRGEAPLENLRKALTAWLERKPLWRGELTELQLLNLERTNE